MKRHTFRTQTEAQAFAERKNAAAHTHKNWIVVQRHSIWCEVWEVLKDSKKGR